MLPRTDVIFQKSVYDLETIKKAAYRFIDRFASEFRSEDETIVCTIIFSNDISVDEIDKIVTDFKKEVLDQDLRKLVASETSAVRNAILALAFSRTDLQDNE